jgi:anthranilate synthase/aminodeoxychorismate synthase-like glutamine amidotransferase
MIFVVDNYDSFTWNLVQAIGKVGPDVEVARNDRFDPEEVMSRNPEAIVVSPGPGRPERAGRSMDTIALAERRSVPVLGVCLGHQAIAALHGGAVERAPAPRHGRTAAVCHSGTGLFAGVPSPFEAGRYHSLIVRETGLPPELEVTAVSEDGLVMAIGHRSLPVFGVQFHPESVLTPYGERLISNFLDLARAHCSGAAGKAS